jgi:hypothetical protein
MKIDTRMVYLKEIFIDILNFLFIEIENSRDAK